MMKSIMPAIGDLEESSPHVKSRNRKGKVKHRPQQEETWEREILIR